MTADYIRALHAEREQYMARGLTDRVAQVDAELERLGVEVDTPPARKRAAKKTG